MFYEYFKLSSITPGKNSIHQQFMIYVVCSMDVKNLYMPDISPLDFSNA